MFGSCGSTQYVICKQTVLINVAQMDELAIRPYKLPIYPIFIPVFDTKKPEPNTTNSTNPANNSNTSNPP